MKQILVFYILFINISVFSQNWEFSQPDYSEIEKAINNQNSEFYYPKLFERYNAYDTSLNLDEKKYLYFGYIFQPGYSPYGYSNLSDSIDSIFNKEVLTPDDYHLIVMLSDSLLSINPFDIRAINNKLYCYEQLLYKIDYNKNLVKLGIIIDAIMSSGNGVSKSTAFYVIYISHEYDLLNVLGFKFGGQQSLIEHFDYLKLMKNDAGIDGLYFDVSPCLNHLRSLLDN